MQFIHYRVPYVLRHHDLAGMSNFAALYRIYDLSVSPIDRTDTIKFPVRTKALFPLPKMRKFTKTYVELCDVRAKELLTRAERLDTCLYVFWSGGVDSTCTLVSLLKHATAAQKERIVVLLTEHSIIEYPAFYSAHIRGKLRRDSPMLFPYLLGSKNIIVTGELNDQLFGADIIASVINRFGLEAVMAPYDRQLLATFLAEKLAGNVQMAAFFTRLYECLKDNAPVPLTTNYDVFWWFNFAVKWQTVYMRLLSYVAKRNAANITEQYLKQYYAHFFDTKEFQLWSMNNLDRRIKDSWHSYKWPAKDIIYGFTKDAEYRDNKIKRGSLQYLSEQNCQFNFIDDKLKLHAEIAPEEFYEEDNDFVPKPPMSWSSTPILAPASDPERQRAYADSPRQQK